jgi:predicted regulator of Ras-like GTPase activity (Roadblock/LC7/MglB family)
MTKDAEYAFAEIIGEGDQTVLLLDHRGGVRAGVYIDSNGQDVSGEIGAALSGVGMEATRSMRHLDLGEWRAIVCECTEANLALAPADDGDVVLVAAAPTVPHGFVRRLLDMASNRALAWRREVA